MWIRSQDKKRLINTSNLYVFGTCLKSSDVDFALGNYKSEERALEVLDIIQSRIIKGATFDYINNSKRTTKEFVFQMPEE
ncbi:hypothetical protein [Terrisporobacter mayombei]|uniref:Polymerase beta nucleotidyltransferase domain-containing protein n=1 Tax=Terrisporobacter mayombei TaxID=1541 RepID=A0ABY9PW42_9FIRM|nr:hypothetical protein [Terrisporobacter mayombei]MCC3870257.1 hypothetical protein [Terrisporobacter mayombei]WMT79882.1 hypothetical protein TEMA_01530 [Terrisporobacter mayombei]